MVHLHPFSFPIPAYSHLTHEQNKYRDKKVIVLNPYMIEIKQYKIQHISRIAVLDIENV